MYHLFQKPLTSTLVVIKQLILFQVLSLDMFFFTYDV